jgi:hypothetical protein
MIGVGKGETLPALRTVHAVLPHTALQSVVSSSGLARQNATSDFGSKPSLFGNLRYRYAIINSHLIFISNIVIPITSPKYGILSWRIEK